MAQEVSIGDRLDRCTFLIRPASGSQGTGTLISPDKLLTCAHLVKEKGERVLVYDRTDSDEPFAEGKVVERGDPKGADDLALVVLDESSPGRGVLSFVGWKRGEQISMAGFPSAEKSSVRGYVGGDSEKGWLEVEAQGVTPGFSGAAAWSTRQEAAIGLVRGYEGAKKAHIIPKGVIEAFLPSPSEAETEPMTCDLPNLGDDRWVQVFDSDGQLLGSGFRLGAQQILTGHGVARRSATLRVQTFAATRILRHPTTVLWPQDTEQAEKVAILETKTVLDVSVFEIPFAPAVTPQSQWKTVYYPRAAEHSSDRRGVGGLLSPSDGLGLWRVDTIQDSEGARPDPEVVVGSAVFVCFPRQQDSEALENWSLLGVLGLDSQGKFVVHGVEGLRSRLGLQKNLDDDRVRYPRNRVRRLLLADETAREALVDRDDDGDWRKVKEDPEALASALCSDTDPYVLTERTYNAFCDLLESKQSSAADQAFDILMAALPAALGKHWFADLPEARATEIQIGLFNQAWVEFALAAAESGEAHFDTLPPKKEGTHFPLPTHQVTLVSPDELGYDPTYGDVKKEVVRDVRARLLSGMDPEQLGLLIGEWATQELGAAGVRWFDPGELPKPVDQRAEGSVLAKINRDLSRPTRTRRRFYLLATEGSAREKAVVAGLRKVLPGLKIVTLEGLGPEVQKFEDLLSLLKNLFNERSRQFERRSNP